MEVVIILLFIIIVLMKLFEPKIKGCIGEKQVERVLSKIKGYKILHDIMLKTETGITQIDRILIGRKGIFVMETKNYDS